ISCKPEDVVCTSLVSRSRRDSLHPLRNIYLPLRSPFRLCCYINLEGSPSCPSLPTYLFPRHLLNFLVKPPVRALRRTNTFRRAHLRSQPRAMMSAERGLSNLVDWPRRKEPFSRL